MAVTISSFRPQKQGSDMHLSNIHREAVHKGSRCIIRKASAVKGDPYLSSRDTGIAVLTMPIAMEKKPRKAIRACIAIAFPFL